MPARLIGISAIARRLNITRQRVHVLANGATFPRPAHELDTGRVWRDTDVERWIAEHPRYDHSTAPVDLPELDEARADHAAARIARADDEVPA